MVLVEKSNENILFHREKIIAGTYFCNFLDKQFANPVKLTSLFSVAFMKQTQR